MDLRQSWRSAMKSHREARNPQPALRLVNNW